MTRGHRISQCRKQLGISQETLGERLGVSRQAVSKWETDTASPDMENLLALAREFNVSVAELTQTPEEPSVSDSTSDSFVSDHHPPFRRIFLPVICAILALLLIGSLALTFLLNRPFSDPAEQSAENLLQKPLSPPEVDSSPPEQSLDAVLPSLAPETDFALLWNGANGGEEFLELGVQEDFFPFSTTLELTAPEIILDTDFHLTDLHVTTCGSINLDYLHIEEDLAYAPASPTRESILRLSTIASSIRTPRGIHVGSTKAAVTEAYGDELVYCLKEQDSYTLVQHDYYSRAFFSDPILFVKSLAADYPAEAKACVLHLTAYDAEWYPAELADATHILETYLADYAPCEEETAWAKLLLLYFSTPIDARYDLPKKPTP